MAEHPAASAPQAVNVIAASRREHLPWWGRLILRYLPRRVYRQVLREYDIGKQSLRFTQRSGVACLSVRPGSDPPPIFCNLLRGHDGPHENRLGQW